MSNIEELEKLSALKDSGIITENEFQKEKKRILEVGSEKPKKGFLGSMLKLLSWGFVIFIVVIIIVANSDNSPSVDVITKLKQDEVSDLQPYGDLASTFALMGSSTDLQRENKLKEIKGKVVQWSLPVYEVKASGEGYRIQTYGMTNGFNGTPVVPAFIDITPENDEDRKLINELKTGNFISFKGKIVDVTIRHLKINPAILYSSEPQVQQTTKADPKEIVEPILSDQIESPEEPNKISEDIGSEQVTTNPTEYDKCASKDLPASELSECAGNELTLQDKRLNIAYKEAIKTLPELKVKQRAWIKHRDELCPENANSSSALVIWTNCLASITEERANELEKLLTPSASVNDGSQ